MTKKLFLLVVLGMLSALPAHAYKWWHGATEFDPSENRTGNAYTVSAMGGYEINFSLLCYHTGAVTDAWAYEIALYAGLATAKTESDYTPILVITSLGQEEERELRSYSETFRMNLSAQDSSGVFSAPDGSKVEALGIADAKARGTLTFPHQAGDEGAYMDITWIPAQRWTGREVKFMVKVSERNITQDVGNSYVHYLKGLFATNSMDVLAASTPILTEPVLSSIPGNLAMQYYAYDTIIKYSIHRLNLDPRMKGRQATVVERMAEANKPIPQNDIVTMRADDYSYEVQAVFSVSRGMGVTDTISAIPHGLIFPAYHSIHNFKVEKNVPSEGSYKGVYSGCKQISWEVHHVDHPDVMESDMFEIQRASDPNFTNAQQVELIPYASSGFSRDEPEWMVGVDKFPCRIYTFIDTVPAALNSDSIKSPMYYRVRRVTSAIWQSGWQNEYSQSTSIHSPVYLAMPYVDEETPVFSYGETYNEDRAINIRVPFTPNEYEGNYFSWDPKAQVVLIRYWSDLPTSENPQPREEQLEIRIPGENMVFEGGRWYLVYTDHPSTPCVNYRYAIRVEAGNSNLPLITYDTAKEEQQK